ncbi:putative DNA-binding transcriptional regulator [Klebsiella pneumoniae]|uniref:Putative DNA-binding transcriptional regulator n=1 Tax=Klebsiella pneumoniae TaxID=573 RepID=A0A378AH39_KLEPN|nr:putative DNA-binding transcriptional regulator [Klebsiella pneumoniae]
MILLLTQDDTVNLSKIHFREQLAADRRLPSDPPAGDCPLHHYLTRLIAAWTGCEASDTQMILHTHALLGEVLAFRLGRETILLRTGWTQFDAQKNGTDFRSHYLSYRFHPAWVIAKEFGLMKKPVVVILLIVILLAALGGGWWWYQSSRQQPLTLYGNVDIRTVNMSFRVGGRLASLTVDEGDSIPRRANSRRA